jgi:nitrogen fixation protein NifZ
LRVLRDDPAGVSYQVHFNDRPTLQVPESALVEVDALVAQRAEGR